MLARYLVHDLSAVPRDHAAVVVLGYLFLLGSPCCVRVRRTHAPDARGTYIEQAGQVATLESAGAQWHLSEEATVPTSVAETLLKATPWKVVKNRRYIPGADANIDIYRFGNEGLVIAEFAGAPTVRTVPEWCGDEVTLDVSYQEENLAVRPYMSWRQIG